ncbi:hypothetical protein VTL71DRAFT_3449 [Oculimacula yallundae]|uniref:Uncharacterized protein n=1 Tax=Oculimacula yallundae TaxID=86028 RepID=A0ABR4C941_9HELO
MEYARDKSFGICFTVSMSAIKLSNIEWFLGAIDVDGGGTAMSTKGKGLFARSDDHSLSFVLIPGSARQSSVP